MTSVVKYHFRIYKIRCRIFANPWSWASSKIGHDFINKWVLKLKLPKNHFDKKCAPKLLFFIEKNRKIRMIFDTENSL